MTEESFVIVKSGYKEYHAPAERKNMHQEEDRTDLSDEGLCCIFKVLFLIMIVVMASGLLQILGLAPCPLRGQEIPRWHAIDNQEIPRWHAIENQD